MKQYIFCGNPSRIELNYTNLLWALLTQYSMSLLYVQCCTQFVYHTDDFIFCFMSHIFGCYVRHTWVIELWLLNMWCCVTCYLPSNMLFNISFNSSQIILCVLSLFLVLDTMDLWLVNILFRILVGNIRSGHQVLSSNNISSILVIWYPPSPSISHN